LLKAYELHIEWSASGKLESMKIEYQSVLEFSSEFKTTNVALIGLTDIAWENLVGKGISDENDFDFFNLSTGSIQ
jgi:hypothetical protein